MIHIIIFTIIVLIIFILLNYYLKRRENFSNQNHLVVTMTTLPERIISHHFKKVVFSLLNQSLKPKCILLNIPYLYKNKKYVIPNWIKKHKKIIINRCEDKGPATKFLGSLNIIPSNYLLFICDDDIVYSNNILKDMKEMFISYNNDFIVLANKVKKTYSLNEPLGFSGIMCKKFLIENISVYDKPKSCFFIDDTWLAWTFHKLGIPVIKTNLKFSLSQETKDHPEWYELCKDTNRKDDTPKCIKDLDKIYNNLN